MYVFHWSLYFFLDPPEFQSMVHLYAKFIVFLFVTLLSLWNLGESYLFNVLLCVFDNNKKKRVKK